MKALCAIVAVLVPLGGCSGAPAPAPAGDSMPTALTLEVPSAPADTQCVLTAKGAPMRKIAVSRTFAEPFDRLDMKRWMPHYDGGYDWPVKRTLAGTGEQQFYVDKGYRGTAPRPLGLNPFSVTNGTLTITGDKIPGAALPYLYGRRYMSGLLTTRQSFVQTYGYFEMRGKVPGGQGVWPAFWLLPADKFWPAEIDVIEVRGRTPQTINMTTHWNGGQDTGTNSRSSCTMEVSTSTSAFHDYGVLWEADQITYYIDRRPVGALRTPPGLGKPMYMLVNLALGGRFGGDVDATTPLPARFDVDHIAAYALGGEIGKER